MNLHYFSIFANSLDSQRHYYYNDQNLQTLKNENSEKKWPSILLLKKYFWELWAFYLSIEKPNDG